MFRHALPAAIAIATISSVAQANEEKARCHLQLPGFSIEMNYLTRTTRTCESGVVTDRFQNVVPKRVAALIELVAGKPIIARVRYVQDCPAWKPTPNIRRNHLARTGTELPTIVAPYCRTVTGDGRDSLEVAYLNRGNPLGVHFIALEFPHGSTLTNDVGLHGTSLSRFVLERRAESADCIRFCNRSIRIVALRVKQELLAGREVLVAFIAVEDQLDRAAVTSMESCVEGAAVRASR